MKTEPDVYSIDNLKKEAIGRWEGVRNFQTRNFMRDSMQIGNRVLFSHSSTRPPGVAGLAEVCSKSKSSKENPIWIMVDVKFIEKFPRVITLEEIRNIPKCQHTALLRRGQRLSIQPVSKEEFEALKSFSN